MTDAQVEVEEKLRRKKEEEEEMWREYAEQRRLQRLKEEEELRKLKVSSERFDLHAIQTWLFPSSTPGRDKI